MTQSLTGLQVISFESRLKNETAALLEKHGARVLAAPALREAPLSEIPEAKAFAEAVCEGAIDALVLLTGVGATLLLKAACNYRPRAELALALSKLTLVCRGPKPANALKPFGLRPTFSVPEAASCIRSGPIDESTVKPAELRDGTRVVEYIPPTRPFTRGLGTKR